MGRRAGRALQDAPTALGTAQRGRTRLQGRHDGTRTRLRELGSDPRRKRARDKQESERREKRREKRKERKEKETI